MHTVVDAIRLNPHITDSDQDIVSIQHSGTKLPQQIKQQRSSENTAAESFTVLLSADQEALTMQGSVFFFIVTALAL